ncbi:SEC-C domain-containing protein [bacterium]|nr:SEC-C domain-containing protein [bacterium]
MSRTGRNEPCPCGSGKKYKKCCLDRDEQDALKMFPPLPDEEPKGLWAEDEEPRPQPLLRDMWNPSFLNWWTKEEVEGYGTEELIAKLRSLGIEFEEEQFLEDARRLKSSERISDHWMETFNVKIEGRDEDFPPFAAKVLLDRLGLDVSYVEHIVDLIEEGYDLDRNQARETCDIWLLAWEKIVRDLAPEHRSVEALDSFANYCLSDWCQDLEKSLLEVAGKNPSYHEKRIAYCEEFVRTLTESDESALRYMKRAAAESLFELGGPERGDAAFEKLVQECPDWLGGYIGWGDMYHPAWFGEHKDSAKAERIYRMALDKGLEDEDEDVAQRLETLEELRQYEDEENSSEESPQT